MDIPPINNNKWVEVVKGDVTFDVEFFPLKLLLARQRLQTQIDTKKETLEKCAQELRQIFIKNQNHPIARKDLEKIFKRQGLLKRIFRKRS